MIAELSVISQAARNVIALIKDLRDALPTRADRARLDIVIAKAERDIALAESATAKDLGYNLCKCTFPPQIMLFEVETHTHVCLRCHHTTQGGDRIYVE